MSTHVYNWPDTIGREFLRSAWRDPHRVVSVRNGSDVLQLQACYAWITALIMGTLVRREIPIPNDCILNDTIIVNNDAARLQTAALNIFIDMGFKDMNQITMEMLTDLNTFSNYIATEMGSHLPPLDMFTISRTLRNPKLREVLDSFDPNDYIHLGVKAVEEAFKDYSKRVVARFCEVRENNCFRPYLILGALNAGQFVKLVGCIGLGTDVDETVIPIPITSNHLNGYESICFFGIDSLSAKKADHYTNKNMSDAQYMNRMTQQEASSVGLIKTGDCGTDLTIRVMITEKFKTRYVGKHVIINGQTIELTKKNINDYVGALIDLRSPGVCRHNTSYCQECGGRMAKIFPQHTNAGTLAILEFFSDMVQSILSAKHLAVTHILIYYMHKMLTEIFDIRDNRIFFRQDQIFDARKLVIGVPTKDVTHIGDLAYVRGKSLNEQFFSQITHISVADGVTGEVLVSDVPVVDANGNTLFFTKEYLRTIRDKPEMVFRNEDMTWFRLDDFNPKDPLICIPSVSESALMFIKRVMSFFQKGVTRYTDFGAALHDLSHLVWERSDANIIHLEVVLKACLITDERNYEMPRVTDPANVKFGGLKDILQNRHFGTELAFQEISDVITRPSFYLQRKPEGIFDQFLGTRDHVVPEQYGLKPVAERRYENRPAH